MPKNTLKLSQINSIFWVSVFLCNIFEQFHARWVDIDSYSAIKKMYIYNKLRI